MLGVTMDGGRFTLDWSTENLVAQWIAITCSTYMYYTLLGGAGILVGVGKE